MAAYITRVRLRRSSICEEATPRVNLPADIKKMLRSTYMLFVQGNHVEFRPRLPLRDRPMEPDYVVYSHLKERARADEKRFCPRI